MILIGNDLVPFENISTISTKEEIKNTQPNSTVVFTYETQLISYISQQQLPYGVIVSTLKEAIFANALNAKYIIVKTEQAKEIQKVAENYIFDAKILAMIESDDEIESLANDEIDGVIYKKVLS